MYVGIGLFMLILGAILRYAVSYQIAGISLQMVGTILMVGGVLALIVSLIMAIMRRRSTGYSTTRTQSYDPNTNTSTQRTDVDPY
ncbi:MAG: DUF6458 family protein [Actinomycetales bacterium]